MNENELIGSAVVAWMGAKGIELVKNSKLFPWLSTETEVLNRWAARLVALVSTLGVHASFDAAAGALMITGLTFSGVGSSVLEYARQFMLQEVAYKKFVRNGSPKP
jgi:hypothetical protein